MSTKTVGELARETQQPEWKIRRMADSLPDEIPRAGLYRLLSDNVQEQIRDKLRTETSQC